MFPEIVFSVLELVKFTSRLNSLNSFWGLNFWLTVDIRENVWVPLLAGND